LSFLVLRFDDRITIALELLPAAEAAPVSIASARPSFGRSPCDFERVDVHGLDAAALKAAWLRTIISAICWSASDFSPKD
jgi:hypothetical protein